MEMVAGEGEGLGWARKEDGKKRGFSADAGIVSKVYGDRVVPEICTEVSYCEHNGPAIRFPFRLKGKPLHCPSPLLETGGRKFIKLCPSGLDNPENQTNYYAVNGQFSIDDMPLVSCTKLRDYTSVPDISSVGAFSLMMLQWSKPLCGRCEEMGKTCRLKRTIGQYNFTDNQTAETECVSEDSTRGRTSLEISSIFSLSVVVTVAGTLIYRVYSSNRTEKTNQLRIERFLDDYIAHKPIGQGAYGTVFKGRLSSDLLVAVKILNNSNEKGEDFTNEVGTMGRVHHVNGYTTALVYEFLPNGSLQNFLSSADSESAFLGWDKLHEIASGIAKGIEYLHQGCDHRILHFDIKPHNILLDQNFTPKVSDFGLAKKLKPFTNLTQNRSWPGTISTQSAISMTTIRGTMGYIAPEVFSRNFGNVSNKSDVYSFGMLLLEMVGGTKNFKFMEEDSTSSQVYFPKWIYNLLEQGDDLRIHIEDGGDAEHAKKVAIVGLWCVQWHPIDRSSMKVVIQMLEEGDNLTVPTNPFRSTSN
ncbi:unnamed protein product [Malus baccata var. baccata]